ncbi:unnamed protein product [Rotaria magnacalcarata]|uniref:Uncharacterized protein n=4 Tax=Rotaria magnacalcarata TaxID=392030 RepID=A0A814XPW4_9BILA|nr:unnamed protein product [Rotaria magnacalcarata]CAF1968372.1 unnamed protein product [Rotaria magnacalcarata]CAF2134445.1 unnamed protein product [Rotaria magnacalcarata]CAF3824745.1 unnamed protein product [Rotaria magnacalcarata]CAF3852069.1 unnamed protein product [Rotaria magnacalcarata]
MQSNSNEQGYNQQDNNYYFEGVYQSYEGTPPPPYSVNPQQTVNGTAYTTSNKSDFGQTPLYQQQSTATTPVNRPFWNNNLRVPITKNLRIFLIISGFFYALWGIIEFSLQTAIVVNSYSTYYNGFWTGIFFIVAGILMTIIGFQSSYPILRLVRFYIVNLTLCALAFSFSMINYAISTRCTSRTSRYCDDNLSSNLKCMLMITFSIGLMHTVVNMIVISKEHKRILAQFSSNILI